MRVMLLCSIVALLYLVPFAQAELPEYSVLRTTEKIVIDGILDEEDWSAAPSFGPFQFPWWKSGEKEQTEVKIMWDDTFLYHTYRCDDKYIWADHHDTNAATCLDDCVELFWDPDPANPKRKYKRGCRRMVICGGSASTVAAARSMNNTASGALQRLKGRPYTARRISGKYFSA